MESQPIVAGDSCFRSRETFHHCFPELGKWVDSFNSLGCKGLGGVNFLQPLTPFIKHHPTHRYSVWTSALSSLLYKTLENTLCHKREAISYANAGSVAYFVLQNLFATFQFNLRDWETFDLSELAAEPVHQLPGETHDQAVARVLEGAKYFFELPTNFILSCAQFTYFEPDLWSRHSYSYTDGTHVHRAASTNKLSIIKYFHNRGESINNRDKRGATPLHSAAQSGSEDAIKLLLELKADFLAKTDDGETFLDTALNFKGANFVEKLLSNLTPYQIDQLALASVREMKEATTRCFLKYYLTLPDTSPLENLKRKAGENFASWLIKMLDESKKGSNTENFESHNITLSDVKTDKKAGEGV